ncbi:MAG: PrpF domain-containing protein [Peptococcaceae bacterium]|jgi:2-methylaconitate cis-trans-isomerase PrpF|nr:proline racemase family protein [Peptococcaceae bacterium]MDH7525584.1 PrpF domain-containing protein [Peptococcaceae bacterium]
MHPQMTPYRVVIHRGGTSKGIFIKRNELPADPEKRDKVIRAIFGSPDLRQIDGLGGADVLTSKLAIIGPPTRPDADVDYTFAQVSFETDFVDFGGNCGNISAGVGPFAIDEGMVEAKEPVTKVRIHQTNTNSIIIADVPVVGGKAAVEGTHRIDGVPGTGAKIMLDFSDSAGAITGKLLPTGNSKDVLDVAGYGKFEVSIVDAANPLVFIEAKSLGMVGTETPAEIEADKELMKKIEAIRGTATIKIGLAKTLEEATKKSPYIPFFAIVSKPAAYKSFLTGETVNASDADIVSRLLFMLRMHKTYPGTGTVCTGAAARIPGTIVYDLLSGEAKKKTLLRIGHPGGVIEVEAKAEITPEGVKLQRAAYDRTARRIMEGYVWVKNSVL